MMHMLRLPGTFIPSAFDHVCRSVGKKSRIQAVAAAAILILLVLFSGCSMKMQSDMFLVKLQEDGTFSWIQVIDSTLGTNVSEVEGGDFLITGGTIPVSCGGSGYVTTMTAPALVMLSPQGDLNWFNTYSYGKGEGLVSAGENPDGSFHAQSESGEMLIIHDDGRLAKTSSPQNSTGTEVTNRIFRNNAGYSGFGGMVLDNFTFSTRNGRFFSESDDGGFLTMYIKTKGVADYYRLVKTDTDWKIIWDKPFLTIRSRHGAYPEDAIIIHQIIRTSDRGYIIRGQRERKTDC